MSIKRREFLGTVAAGSAIVTMPAFLSGCGVQQASAIADKTPANPFMDWFAVDQATVARVMSELTANGADAADLYFQHIRSNNLRLEDGIVSAASSDIQQRAGLRVVIGDPHSVGHCLAQCRGSAAVLRSDGDGGAVLDVSALGGCRYRPQAATAENG